MLITEIVDEALVKIKEIDVQNPRSYTGTSASSHLQRKWENEI